MLEATLLPADTVRSVTPTMMHSRNSQNLELEVLNKSVINVDVVNKSQSSNTRNILLSKKSGDRCLKLYKAPGTESPTKRIVSKETEDLDTLQKLESTAKPEDNQKINVHLSENNFEETQTINLLKEQLRLQKQMRNLSTHKENENNLVLNLNKEAFQYKQKGKMVDQSTETHVPPKIKFNNMQQSPTNQRMSDRQSNRTFYSPART